ncbi:MAG: NYN domain-containing protein [Planctomycetota bacterium]|nr:NYN domain-containing protein [Planctomycetota bacterium]
MKYVIDACNLIFGERRLEETLEREGFQAAKALLVGMLSRFARAERLEEIVAVFDGSEKAAHRPRMQREALGTVVLIYADPRENADRCIIELVENARRPGEITVVSNDKFITREVRRAQGHQIGCRDFLRRMRMAIKRAADPLGGEDPRKFGTGLTAREIEEWTKWFEANAKCKMKSEE